MHREHSILVVDDDHNLRCTLTLILKKAGYQVMAAQNCASAKEAISHTPFHLVILDLRLPDGEGLSFLTILRERDPEVPVLILTAYASIETAIEALRMGAKDYLLKPVDPAQILHSVEHLLTETNKPRLSRDLLLKMRTLLKEIENEPDVLGAVEETENVSTQDDLYWNGAEYPHFYLAKPGDRYLFCGPFKLDLHARHLFFECRIVSLSPTVFDYLHTLIRHSPKTVTFEALVEESQGFRADRTEAQEIARWRIHELRKAIEPDLRQPRYIITVRGEGYRILP